MNREGMDVASMVDISCGCGVKKWCGITSHHHHLHLSTTSFLDFLSLSNQDLCQHQCCPLIALHIFVTWQHAKYNNLQQHFSIRETRGFKADSPPGHVPKPRGGRQDAKHPFPP